MLRWQICSKIVVGNPSKRAVYDNTKLDHLSAYLHDLEPRRPGSSRTAASGAVRGRQIQYPGVARSIRSDVDNLLRLVSTFSLLPDGLYVREAAEVRPPAPSRAPAAATSSMPSAVTTD